MTEGLAEVHPIVAQLTPSEEQMPAIKAEAESVVVTAGAGAGKTRTLVARYLYLLAHEALSPRRIAAITFTRKAAREMRNRVREAISTYLGEGLSPEEHARWDRCYSQLDAARIGTIHQLCTEILRAHPAEAQVDPRFEVLDEAQAALLQTQAMERALAWAAEDREGAALFELLGERRLQQVLAQLLQERLKTRAAFRGSREALLARWQEALEREQIRATNALTANPAWQAQVATLRREEPSRDDDRMAEQRALALAALDGAAAAGTPAEKGQKLAALDQINLSGGSQKAWPGGKEQLQSVKDALRVLRELWREQAGLQGLSLTPLDEELAARVPALHELFARADKAYRRLKAERQVLDFDDLEAEALQLLAGSGAVRSRWQEELAALLVDEYQDTNGRQRDLVNLLHGDGNRLFIVGDAKQSIYRFRGAEVAVFREERERIAAGNGRGYNLATSYRPHKGLLDGLNALLEAVMGTGEMPGQPWVEPFAPLTHYRQEPLQGLDAPYISLQLALGNKEDGLPVAAQALAAEIVKMVEDDTVAVEYGDVAILCRASTSFEYYEDVLDEWGIPYLTVAGRGFYERPEIRDLLNGLAAIMDPTDDLALVGVLRSPVGGYRDGELYALRRAQQANGSPTLWEEIGREAQQPVISLLRQLNSRAGREPVADLLKSFLDESDYRAALRRAGQQRAIRNVEKLLALAHESGLVAVSDFLEYVENVRATSGREGEARATAGNAVQIMSVHQAKGLEFPVVVIGDLNKMSGGRTSLLIREDWGVLPLVKDELDNQPVAFQLGKREEDAQEVAESRRLLYVATTRARDRLILNGSVQLNKGGRPGRLNGWLKEMAGPLGLLQETVEIEEEGARALARELRVGEVTVGCTFYEPKYRPERPGGSDREGETRRSRWTAPLLEPIPLPAIEKEERPARRIWRVVPEEKVARRAPSWLIGSLVHEALAAWRFPEGGADAVFERWARTRAREYGLTDEGQIGHAAGQTLTLLQRFRRHALFDKMDRARRLHELPYTMTEGDSLALGQVDVLYQREGRWHVVDFKTDRVHDRRVLKQILAEKEYEAQVQRYARAVAQLLGEAPVCSLCFLDYEGSVYEHPVAVEDVGR